MKLQTPIEVFEHIRDEMLGKRDDYICNSVLHLWEDELITNTLSVKCLELLQIHKPNNDSFTKFKYWYGGCSWWCVSKAKLNNELSLLIQEKKRYCTYLIDQIGKNKGMGTIKMTARKAIEAMESAIKGRDKERVLELYSPDDTDILPDWDDEPDYIWEEWQVLIEKAEQILGL